MSKINLTNIERVVANPKLEFILVYSFIFYSIATWLIWTCYNHRFIVNGTSDILKGGMPL